MLKKSGSNIGDFSRSQRFLKGQTPTSDTSAKTSVCRAVILLKIAISHTQLSELESGSIAH